MLSTSLHHPMKKNQSWTGSDGYRVIVVSGSIAAAMEMVMANRFRPNDRVLVPTNGKFGERVAEMGARLPVTNTEIRMGPSLRLGEIEEQWQRELEALAICHNEASSGITQDVETAEMCQRHGVAFVIDGITSVGGLPVHPEEWGAEAVVLVHKVHSRPSGIAAIAVNQHFVDRCTAIRNQDDSNPVYYLDILSALSEEMINSWTPAINPAMGWAVALEKLKNEGLEEMSQMCPYGQRCRYFSQI